MSDTRQISKEKFMNLSGDTPTLNYPQNSFGTIKECTNYLFIIEKTIKKDTSIFGMFSKPEKIYYATCITSQEMKKIIGDQYKQYKEEEKLKKVPYIPYELKFKLLYGYENNTAKQKDFVFPETFSKGITHIFYSKLFPNKTRYTQEKRMFLLELEIDNDNIEILKIESLNENFESIGNPLYYKYFDGFERRLDRIQFPEPEPKPKPKPKPYERPKSYKRRK
jgi:hypothetical protein